MSSEVRFGNVSSIDYESGKCEVLCIQNLHLMEQ